MDSFSQQVLIQAFAAFAGAFFAYFFTRIADFFGSVYKRQTQHYNSLVSLESELNDIGSVANDNIYLIPDFVRVISSGHVYFSKLRPIPFNKQHFLDLFDLELMNDLYDYYNSIRKIDDDIDAFMQGYQELKMALIQGSINQVDYRANCQRMAGQLILLKAFQENLLARTTRLMAITRLQIKQDLPLSTTLQRYFLKTDTYKRLREKDIKRAIKIISKELAETGRKSREENERIVREYSDAPDN